MYVCVSCMTLLVWTHDMMTDCFLYGHHDMMTDCFCDYGVSCILRMTHGMGLVFVIMVVCVMHDLYESMTWDWFLWLWWWCVMYMHAWLYVWHVWHMMTVFVKALAPRLEALIPTPVPTWLGWICEMDNSFFLDWLTDLIVVFFSSIVICFLSWLYFLVVILFLFKLF